MSQQLREIESLEQFLELDGELHDAVVQDVDFSNASVDMRLTWHPAFYGEMGGSGGSRP